MVSSPVSASSCISSISPSCAAPLLERLGRHRAPSRVELALQIARAFLEAGGQHAPALLALARDVCLQRAAGLGADLFLGLVAPLLGDQRLLVDGAGDLGVGLGADARSSPSASATRTSVPSSSVRIMSPSARVKPRRASSSASSCDRRSGASTGRSSSAASTRSSTCTTRVIDSLMRSGTSCSWRQRPFYSDRAAVPRDSLSSSA